MMAFEISFKLRELEIVTETQVKRIGWLRNDRNVFLVGNSVIECEKWLGALS